MQKFKCIYTVIHPVGEPHKQRLEPLEPFQDQRDCTPNSSSLVFRAMLITDRLLISMLTEQDSMATRLLDNAER